MNMSKVNTLRASIANKKAERLTVEASRVSHAELRAALDYQLARAADVERGLAHRVGVAHYEDGVIVARGADGRAELLPALVAVFGADVMRTNLSRFIEQAPDGPSKADRDAKLAAIDDDLERLEKAEESGIRAMESAGQEFIRRPDASPAAVLSGL